MKSRFLRLVAVAMLALPFLIASCSKKDKGTGPTPGAAPTLITPSFTQAVNFVGSNAGLLSAKAKVQAELALVAPFLMTPAAFTTAANAGTWGAKVDSCWSKSSLSGSCTTAFEVCEIDTTTNDWKKTLDGTCSGTPLTQFVAIDATIKKDGSNGSFSLFKSATTTLDTLWKWATPTDTSKDFNVYKGTEAPANLVANLHWKKGTGGSASNWTFTMAGSATSLTAGVTTTDPGKWELHISTDGKTGTMDVYKVLTAAAASPSGYYVSDHIAWNPDSTGTWQVYNSNGDLTNETKWPAVPAPSLTIPSFSQTVTFVGSNANLDAAKSKVEAEIGMVAPWLATPSSFVTAANAAGWGNQIGLCWAKSSTSGSCTTAFKVCDAGSATYDWTKTLDGTCSGTPLTQFDAIKAAVKGDGTSGSLSVYQSATTVVDSLWKWVTPTDTSREWNIYKGSESDANRIARLHWKKGTGNSANNWSFDMPGLVASRSAGATSASAKWELHVSTDTKTGTMDIYQQQVAASGAAYYLSDHIAWNPDSSGTWTQYTSTGDSTANTWPTTIPNVVIPTIGHDVVFDTTVQCAYIAWIYANLQVQTVHTFAALGTNYLHVFDSLHLGNQVDGCWNWTASDSGCSFGYKLCQVSGGYHWSWIENGSCPGGPYSNWIVVDGTFSNDGRSATFMSYESGTTTVTSALTWSTAADGKSGSIRIYTGEVSEANLESQITWSVATDGATDLDNETFGSSPTKWVSHVSGDGKSGFSKYYQWDDTPPGSFWLEQEIDWNSDGSGSDKTYQQDGTVIDDCEWT